MRLLALLFWTLVLAATAAAGELTLGRASHSAQAFELLADAGKILLRIDSKSVALATPALPDTQSLQPDQPFEIQPCAPIPGRAFVVTFGLSDGHGLVRSIAALITASDNGWRVSHEWSVNCSPLGELGFIREKQRFLVNAGTLVRSLQKFVSEGVVDKLDCGCFTCGSRTTETVEDEQYEWDANARALKRVGYERRYVVQPGEGVMAVARKALGDARMVARISRLNPDLKANAVLQPGQKIVVERLTQ